MVWVFRETYKDYEKQINFYVLKIEENGIIRKIYMITNKYVGNLEWGEV